MIKKNNLIITIITFFLILISFNTLLAENNIKDTSTSNNNYLNNEFNYLDFYIDKNSSTNKVSYSIIYPQNNYYKFRMQLYYNSKINEDICAKELKFDKETIFTKITCKVPKLGNGEYTFESFFYDKNNNLIKKLIDKEFILKNNKINMNFNVKNNKTYINIKVNTNKSIIIENEIPKSVIKELNDENKNELIVSNKTYTIIDPDPLIAWNIEPPQNEINYTINKKITPKQQKEFKLEVKNDKSFQMLKYIILSLIILIIILLFRPILNKKNDKKKNK